MKTRTYLVDNNFDSEYSDGALYVRLTLSTLDVDQIIYHAKYLRDTEALCIEVMDHRCEFFGIGEDGTPEPDEFRQEAPRMAIFGDYIVFTGYQKHGSSNSEWSTDRLMITEIAKDFGIAPRF